MKRYYPRISDFGACLERCQLVDNGTGIGSIACAECEFYINGHDKKGTDTAWLICKHINLATGKKVV